MRVLSQNRRPFVLAPHIPQWVPSAAGERASALGHPHRGRYSIGLGGESEGEKQNLEETNWDYKSVEEPKE
ncbi:MAG: hypothetical protein GDA67_02080 [Nitrospira sp. CR1.3]|nr:hypothetical protein [Nitrospira sp. CR1.3]